MAVNFTEPALHLIADDGGTDATGNHDSSLCGCVLVLQKTEAKKRTMLKKARRADLPMLVT